MTDHRDPARHYESYRIGEIIRGPGITLTESEIIEFAFRYDPQPHHLDKVAAEKSIYGGMIASGWQVAATGFRMLVQAGFIGSASMGSNGMSNLTFHMPVRPGDTISGEVEITEKRESKSRPELGLVTMLVRIFNQNGEKVCSWDAVQFVLKRPAA
ncbi:MaoC family dehydratase [Minwuia sp.]|uniref:MaoC family dehydratase n=1 Tax=Minwuia sp. TaxID=2493630 RepID=UPI003A922DD9